MERKHKIEVEEDVAGQVVKNVREQTETIKKQLSEERARAKAAVDEAKSAEKDAVEAAA